MSAETRQTAKPEDYRVEGEIASLAATLGLLLAVYFAALLLLYEEWSHSWKAQAFTILTLFLYFLTVLFQQRSVYGTLVRVSEKQFPEIFHLAKDAASRLGAPTPAIYIKRSSEQAIYTMGIWGRGPVVLHSSLIDALPPENLQFFLGKEIGHMEAGHSFLRGLLKPSGGDVPVIGKVVNSVIFGDWWNRAERTADRAGLIACNSLSASVSAMLKIGIGTQLFEKLDIHVYLEQAYEVRSVGGRVAEIVSVQPYLTKRIQDLARYALSERFRRIAPAEAVRSDILQLLPQNFLATMGIQKPKTAVAKASTAVPSQRRFVLIRNDGREILLNEGKTRLGRSSENEIQLDEDRVSRFHAEIAVAGKQILLEDKGSTNGVWVNGIRIPGIEELREGDHIRIGEREFTLRRKSSQG